MQTACRILTSVGRIDTKGRWMSGQSDQAVVEQVINGDLDAFSTLVERYQDRVYSAVLNYVSNPEDAVDITQEAFVKAYSNLKRFNSSSAFYTGFTE